MARVIRKKKKATILFDYNASTCTAADDMFDFIDCSEANPKDVARDLRSGITENTDVIIAIGNSMVLDNYTNLSGPPLLLAKAIIQRYGCTGVRIYITAMLPRLGLDVFQEQVLKKQNKSLSRAIRAVVRREKFPINFIPAHTWLLKRVEMLDGSMEIRPDLAYYDQDTGNLSGEGLSHLHLLLGGRLNLRKIEYRWEGMPVVKQKNKKRKVLGVLSEEKEAQNTSGAVPMRPKVKSVVKVVKKGHHIRKKHQEIPEVMQCEASDLQVQQEKDEDQEDEPPLLVGVEIPGI